MINKNVVNLIKTMWNFLTKTKVGRWILLALIGAAAVALGIFIATDGKFVLDEVQLFSLLTLYGGILLANLLLIMRREDLGTWKPITERQGLLKRLDELNSIKINMDLSELRKILKSISFIVQETDIDFEKKSKELLNKEDPVTYQELYDHYKDKNIPEDTFYHLVRLKNFYINSLANPRVRARLEELKELEAQEKIERELMEKIFEQIQREDSVD